jgi:hypothetical protein
VLDLIEAADGLAEPAKANLLDGMKRYTRAVIAIEWPAQAEGHAARAGDRFLDEVQRLVVSLKPASQADTNLQALLLESLTRLRDARQERLLTAETTVPGIVWFVVIVSGAITIAFGSFLGAQSVLMHSACAACWLSLGCWYSS